MKYEKSCGVIPFVIENGIFKFLLVEQTNGVICFPKGHVENNENEYETAIRELKEETNIEVELLDGFREEMVYYMPEYDSTKTVVYFIGKMINFKYSMQESEITSIKLLNYEEAYNILQYDNIKEIFKKSYEFINKK